jgi:hypothetical protein
MHHTRSPACCAPRPSPALRRRHQPGNPRHPYPPGPAPPEPLPWRWQVQAPRCAPTTTSLHPPPPTLSRFPRASPMLAAPAIVAAPRRNTIPPPTHPSPFPLIPRGTYTGQPPPRPHPSSLRPGNAGCPPGRALAWRCGQPHHAPRPPALMMLPVAAPPTRLPAYQPYMLYTIRCLGPCLGAPLRAYHVLACPKARSPCQCAAHRARRRQRAPPSLFSVCVCPCPPP